MSRVRAVRGAVGVAITIVIVYCVAGAAYAQDIGQGRLDIDEPTLFRWAISALLSAVVWYARKLDKRIEQLEDRVPKNLMRKIELLDGEDKNTQSLIIMLRDQVNRDHTTKAETVEHRQRVESEIRELRQELREANNVQNTRLEQLLQAIQRR